MITGPKKWKVPITNHRSRVAMGFIQRPGISGLSNCNCGVYQLPHHIDAAASRQDKNQKRIYRWAFNQLVCTVQLKYFVYFKRSRNFTKWLGNVTL